MTKDTVALKSTRNYGVDILRVLSMLMIITAHICTQGGLIDTPKVSEAGRYAVWVLRIFMIVDVNCFGLITGYVTVDSRFRPSRPIALWMQVFFYSVVISAIFYFLGLTAFKPQLTLLPVLSGRWWYITAYFGIVFFLPFIGVLFDHISRKRASLMILALICLFSLLPSAANFDSFNLFGGCSMAWLGILALIGAYIKRFDPFKNIRKSWLLIYVFCMLCICATKIFFKSLPNRFISFSSIFALIGAIALLMFFSRINIAPVVKKTAKILGPLTLGVYLIHNHPCIWENVFRGYFSPIARLNPLLIIPAAIGSAIGVFLICAAIDWVRVQIFRLLKINKLVEILGDKLNTLAGKCFK